MIGVYLERASSTLLLGCLQALTSTTPELTALALYAVDRFPYHLADVDLSMTDPAVRMAIGKLLVSLLTEETTIALWWNPQTILIRRRWFYNDTNVELVLSWFTDSAVTKTFSESNKAWVKTLTSNSSPDADVFGAFGEIFVQEVIPAARMAGGRDLQLHCSVSSKGWSMVFCGTPD